MRFRPILTALLLTTILALTLVAPAAAAPSESGCGPGVTYVVQPGDNLFRISLRFGTTMQAIASANGIWDYNRIFWGTTLAIPCAGTYTPPPPPVYQPPVYQPPVYQPPVYQPPIFYPPVVHPFPPVYYPPIFTSCHSLAGTSPRDGLAYGNNTFYWNPIPGATSYRVNVYNQQSGGPVRLAVSGDAAGNQTNITLNVGGNAGHGFEFGWDVQAFVNGVLVCTTPRYNLLRSAP